jgi:hypothetical protein
MKMCMEGCSCKTLRDRAKAKLLEPQFPAMFRASLDYHIYTARPSVYLPSA